MKSPSLRLRLLTGGAVAVVLALGATGAGISWLFHQHVERREAARLIQIGETLAAGLTLDPDGRPLLDAPPTESRFANPASGLYWQVTTRAGSLQSPSLWDQNLEARPAKGSEWNTDTTAGPFQHQLLTISRNVLPDQSGRQALIQVAEDDAAIRETYAEFDREISGSMLLLAVILSIGAYAQVVLGLRPLDRVRIELDRLRRSPSARLPETHPQEILPLTEAINALAQTREADLARARRRAADLAHSLKTPLAVLTAQSRRAREAGATDAADGLDRAISAVGAALEAELARSRAAAARTVSEEEHATVDDTVEKLIAVIERTEHGEKIIFTVEIDPALRAPLNESDLSEMLGALIDNGARHARRQVRVCGDLVDGGVAIHVEDDGPGMDEAAAAAATIRGRRLDESGSGHGFGLAIVRDLMEATEGHMLIDRSDLGGLRVRIEWPAAA